MKVTKMVPSPSSEKMGRGRGPSGIHDEEYKRRRERNNLAVRKSRERAKEKTKEMIERVNELKTENSELEQKIKTLTKELEMLRNILLEHTSNSHGMTLDYKQLQMLKDEPDVEEGVKLLLSLQGKLNGASLR